MLNLCRLHDDDGNLRLVRGRCRYRTTASAKGRVSSKMPWRGPEYPGEFPTLGYLVAEWIQAWCVTPDRDLRGTPFLLTDEQLRLLVYHYALTPEGAWVYQRGSQLVRPQKHGKGPLAAAFVCAEAEGPVRFAGWDAAGEPVGQPWATPHIQITACSEEQTDNTWRAIQPMIELGPLGETFIPDTGLTRINLRSGGLIEPVTASARSRLGQRITFVVQDQTESWLRSNNGHWLADNQRRNVAGMGGRFLETCNAPDPAEQSVASRTPAEPGVHIDDVDGGPGSVRNKAERRKVLSKVYGDSAQSKGGWVDLDRIDAEIEALLEHDPAQAERFFLNRKLASEGAAFDHEAFTATRRAADRCRAGDRLPRRRRRPPRRRHRRRGHAREDRLPVARHHPRAAAARPRRLRTRHERGRRRRHRRSSNATWCGGATATTSTSAR